MSTFSLPEFQSQVLGRGLARTNRFDVIINIPPCLGGRDNRTISLLCEQASLPLLNINTKSHRIYGPPLPRPVTSEYGGEGLPLTFHVDREMKVKRFFEDWMEKIIDRDTFNVAYKSTYTTFLYISQLDEADNVNYTIDVEDAFPRSMNLMELNNAAQNQTHRLTVLFAYRKWRRIDAGTPGEAETTQQISLNQQISEGFLT
jgi:hypothetical protein